MSMKNSIPWIEKYRPQLLNDVVQNEDLLHLFKNSIKTRNISHMLFYGPPGTGKTSSILAIGRELFREHFAERMVEFNASDDRGINAVRDKITYEAKKFVSEIVGADNVIIPPYKIIILDEADSMTDEAQDALRVVIEEYSQVTRFCFICNYISKITDAIKSRCSHVYFKKLPVECMISKLNEISTKESMLLPIKLLNKIISISNGDMRKAVVMLQNLKYLFELKKLQKKPFVDMTMAELNSLCLFSTDPDADADADDQISSEITVRDIYDMSANIDPSVANEIIRGVITCRNVSEVRKLCSHTIARGYPVDNILLRLNDHIKYSDKFNDVNKAKIFKHSTSILAKVKECSDEYVQLLDYLVSVYSIYKNGTLHD